MKSLAVILSKGAGSIVVKALIVSTAAVGGTAMVSSSVFAALTATATNTSGGSITTGTLSLTMAPSGVSGITGGFTTAISAMGPGDTVNRYVDLTNGGTLDATTPTLQLTRSVATNITDSATVGLQITISACSIAWTNTGTCGGTTTSVLSSTPASTLVASPQSLNLPSNLAGAVNRLKISMALPAGSENVVNGVLPSGTIQGLSTAITWTFVETERAATETNS